MSFGEDKFFQKFASVLESVKQMIGFQELKQSVVNIVQKLLSVRKIGSLKGFVQKYVQINLW